MATKNISDRYDAALADCDPSLKRALKQTAWNVSYTITNLSFQLGKPVLSVVHEPAARAVKSGAARRRIAVHGLFWVWVYNANWRLMHAGRVIASNRSSSKHLAPLLSRINGQRLIDVRVKRQSGEVSFVFDLGTAIEVRVKRGTSASEMWMIGGSDGYVRSMYRSGRFERKKQM